MPGTRPRVVVVRRSYEELVRAGMLGLKPDNLLIGEKVSRKSITGSVLATAEILGNAPFIEQARMRSTWLTHLMISAIPLAVIMSAAGLESARSLTDLLPYAAERLGLDATRTAGQ